MMMANLMQNLGLEVGSIVVAYDFETRKEVKGKVEQMPEDYESSVYIRWDNGDDSYCRMDRIFTIRGRTEYATY